MFNALKKINVFDRNYEKQMKVWEEHPEVYEAKFVPQYYYMYDSRMVEEKCRVIDNLKLYYMNMDRTDITHLSLYYAKERSNKVYYFITYLEKGEFYVESIDGGIAFKTFLTSWTAGRSWKVKNQIPVEREYY